MMDARFKEHRRKVDTGWLRPYEPGEDLAGISLGEVDVGDLDGGYIAINPENEADRWFVHRDYFASHFRH